MATDPVLRMLGLARRAGKLAFGDELVREACFDHKVRCVFIAGDAGASTAKKAAFYAERANVPLVTLPHGKVRIFAFYSTHQTLFLYTGTDLCYNHQIKLDDQEAEL